MRCPTLFLQDSPTLEAAVGEATPPALSRTLSVWGDDKPFKHAILEDYDAFDDVPLCLLDLRMHAV